MIDPDTIERIVAEIFRVTLDDLHGRRRFLRHMRAKHAVAYLLVHTAGYGVTEAAELLGRHYSTVSSSVDVAEQLVRDDPTYAAQLRLCRAAITVGTAPSEVAAPPERTVAETVAKRRDAWAIDKSIHIALYWWGGVPEPLTA